VDILKQALVLYERDHNRFGEGESLLGLGSVMNSLGNTTEAITYLEKALSIFRSAGDKVYGHLS
jgi:hypothetical protein